MVVDRAITIAAATRYRNRTLAYLQRQPDATYLEYAPSFQMPEDAMRLIEEIVAFEEQHGPIRSEDLNLSLAFAESFRDLPEELFGHGADIVAFLYDHLPDAQLVVSEDALSAPAICRLLDDPESQDAWNAFQAQAAALEDSLTEAIRVHQIDAINLSWGLAHKNVSERFASECGRAAPKALTLRILQRWALLLDRLTHARDPHVVLIFQAGAPVREEEVQDFYLDCADLERRLRVYGFAYAESDIPQEVSTNHDLLNAERSFLSCSDLFVVMGREASLNGKVRERGVFTERLLGLGSTTSPWPPAPSFATPIALAHFFYVKARHPDVAPDRLLKRWSRADPQPILDPLLHGQFPVCKGP